MHANYSLSENIYNYHCVFCNIYLSISFPFSYYLNLKKSHARYYVLPWIISFQRRNYLPLVLFKKLQRRGEAYICKSIIVRTDHRRLATIGTSLVIQAFRNQHMFYYFIFSRITILP